MIRKRREKDIWENLYEFYLVESDNECKWEASEIIHWLYTNMHIKDAVVINCSSSYRQQLTHQKIIGKIIEVRLAAVPPTLQDFLRFRICDLSLVAFPKFLNIFLNHHSLLAQNNENSLQCKTTNKQSDKNELPVGHQKSSSAAFTQNEIQARVESSHC